MWRGQCPMPWTSYLAGRADAFFAPFSYILSYTRITRDRVAPEKTLHHRPARVPLVMRLLMKAIYEFFRVTRPHFIGDSRTHAVIRARRRVA